MGTQSVNRTRAIRIIRQAADALQAARTKPEDSTAVSRALARACSELGIEPAAFDALIAADPELELLKVNAIREAVAGSTDPGPHDAISREAATGQPGDTTWGPGAPGAFTK
jgi:hypothetical protein